MEVTENRSPIRTQQEVEHSHDNSGMYRPIVPGLAFQSMEGMGLQEGQASRRTDVSTPQARISRIRGFPKECRLAMQSL